ncbi:Gly-Xaa carboxypeptidase [Xylogone sp. PMI_703]|nr:Gly-Xaa carboxypeptidase [Xylogone sp. PMI_703]
MYHVISKTVESNQFTGLIAHRLSDAVKIPTVVGDGMGHIGEDPQWNIFYEFSKYMQSTFPLVFCHLERTIVNEHGYIFTWKGSDPELKPLLLMAHSDVVPVSDASTDTWTYEPFSGYYDGQYIWGRGSEDDKSNLVAILSTIELLLGSSFKPPRTVIFAIGFDEEGGSEASYGARFLAKGIELIFDEGMAGLETISGTEVAYPATSEKGYMDVTVRIKTPGGHSQEPPEHTAIGYLAQIIQLIEDNPLPPVVSIKKPPGSCLQDGNLSQNKDLSTTDKETHELIQTTTAVTVIHGGDKVNSLPESAYALVNHRIAPHDAVHVVKDNYISLLSPWSEKYHFNFEAFGESLSQFSQASGSLELTSAYDLDPSPVSDPKDPRFSLLAGTIRGVFGEHVAVTPTTLLGNTDTRYYWDLSSQIYRMSPWRASHDPRGTRMHTVDERMPIAGLIEMVRFYHAFILKVDEYRG